MADMYRAMGRYRDDGGECVVALGGVRTRREAAEEDRAAALGAEETWVEEATWTRSTGEATKGDEFRVVVEYRNRRGVPTMTAPMDEPRAREEFAQAVAWAEQHREANAVVTLQRRTVAEWEDEEWTAEPDDGTSASCRQRPRSDVAASGEQDPSA